MMRLDRLAAMVATVNGDGGSDLADALAARWGFGPGDARYVRTSARAVFGVPEGYLRLAAATDAGPAATATVAEVAWALGTAGAPVVAPRRSTSGRWVEQLSWSDPLGEVHGTMVAAAPGSGRELDDLSATQVAEWGTALARLHDAGRTVERRQLPDWLDVVAAAVGAGDPAVAAVVAAWAADCRELLGESTTCVHGDAQPDNIGWATDGALLFDLDDLAAGWPVVDLVIAVRDARPLHDLEPALVHTAVGRDLLASYGRTSELSAEERAAVPLVHRLSAAMTYGRLCAALDVAAAGPEWLVNLRTRLEAIATQLHKALLTEGVLNQVPRGGVYWP